MRSTFLRRAPAPLVEATRALVQHRPQIRVGARLRRRGRALLDGELDQYELGTALGDNGEVASFGLESNDGSAVLKLSYSARGDASLQRGAAALLALATPDSPAEGAPPIPRLIAGCFEPGRTWTVETRCAGVNARALVGTTRRAADMRDSIARAISPLHRRTQEQISLSNGQVDALLRGVEFARSLPPSRHDAARYRANAEHLEQELRAAVSEVRLTTARIHGDLWVGNVMWDIEQGDVAGIIDWEASHRGVPSVEMMHLVVTTRAADDERELGAATRDLLVHEDWRPDEVDLVHGVPGGNELTLRTSLLLAWARHVHANIRKSGRYARNPMWVAHNVHQVLEAV
jgi:hypothetical protein